MIELLTLIVACSPPPPGFYASVPREGIVPANAEVVLLSYSFGTPQITITQEDTAFAVEPIIENGLTLLDLESLGIKDRFTVFATSTEPGSMSVTVELEASPLRDEEFPTFAGIEQLSYEFFEDEPGLCQAGGYHVSARVAFGEDDWGVSYYQLFEVTAAGRNLAGTTYFTFNSQPTLHAYAGHEEGTRCYVAVATDIAGHKTESSPVCIDIGGGTTTDAGVLDSGSPFDSGSPDSGRDAGPRADTGGGSLTLGDDVRGCGCGAAASWTTHSSTSAVLLFLGLALLRRRRP